MDPHEKVNMDAEKIMSNTWDFEFMVKKTLKKLARTTKFHITPLGPSIYIYIYIYMHGPRCVIWNLVVRASFKNVFVTINSKSHEPDMIFSASILTFSCGSNGMGPDI